MNEQLLPEDTGARLKAARQHAGLRQDQAAVALGRSRPTLIAIEQGKRPVRPDELRRLCAAYGVDLASFLPKDALGPALTALFPAEVQASADLFADLLRRTGQFRARFGPHAAGRVQCRPRLTHWDPTRHDARLAGQELAQQMRDLLRPAPGTLGWNRSTAGPLDPAGERCRLEHLLGTEFGLRVFRAPLPERGLLGLSVVAEDTGWAVLLNASTPDSLQLRLLASIFCWTLTGPEHPGAVHDPVRVVSVQVRQPQPSAGSSRAAQFNQAFVDELLLPAEAARQHLRRGYLERGLRATAPVPFTLRCELGHRFQVLPDHLTRSLAELHLKVDEAHARTPVPGLPVDRPALSEAAERRAERHRFPLTHLNGVVRAVVHGHLSAQDARRDWLPGVSSAALDDLVTAATHFEHVDAHGQVHSMRLTDPSATVPLRLPASRVR